MVDTFLVSTITISLQFSRIENGSLIFAELVEQSCLADMSASVQNEMMKLILWIKFIQIRKFFFSSNKNFTHSIVFMNWNQSNLL